MNGVHPRQIKTNFSSSFIKQFQVFARIEFNALPILILLKLLNDAKQERFFPFHLGVEIFHLAKKLHRGFRVASMQMRIHRLPRTIKRVSAVGLGLISVGSFLLNFLLCLWLFKRLATGQFPEHGNQITLIAIDPVHEYEDQSWHQPSQRSHHVTIMIP